VRKPIQVYLDSCDFSLLSEREGSSNEASLDEIYLFLLRAREKGDIEIRYSSITILECIHLGPEHIEYALKRASMIEELSGGSAFVDISTLHLESCLDGLGIKRGGRDRVKREHHQWYTDISPILTRYEKIYVDKLNEIIKKRPKNTRKQLKNMMFSGRGKLSDFALERLTTVGNALERSFLEMFPMLNGFPLQRVMTQYLKRELSESEVTKRIGDVVFSPFNFTKWFVESIRGKTPSSLNRLREQGVSIVSSIESARADFEGMELKFIESGLSEKETKIKLKSYRCPVNQIKKMLLDDIFNSKRALIEQCGVSKSKWDGQLKGVGANGVTAIDLVSELLSEHITRKIHDKRGKLLPSDFGDFMHCSYIPFVDIFRCDKRTATLALDFVNKNNLDTHISPSLVDVVNFIKSNTAF